METATEQDVDLAVEAVFGNLAKDSAKSFAAALLEPSQAELERPPKAAKLELGKRGRPSDSSHFGGRSGHGNKGQGNGGNKAQPQVTALVKAMGKLIIRQETQFQVLKQNSAWQVYLQPGTSGPILVLFKAAEAYKEQAKTKFALLSTLFQTLLHCLQALSTNVAQQKVAQSKGWMTSEGGWCSQKWDSESQSLKVDEARNPVPHQELITLIAKLADLVVVRDVIHRFNATHPISAGEGGYIALHAGGWPSGQGCGGHLERAGEDRQPGGLATCGHADPQTRGAGQRSREASSLVLRLALHDPAHQSYIHSFVVVHLWCFSLLQAPEFQVFGCKVQAWRDVLLQQQATDSREQATCLAQHPAGLAKAGISA